MKPGILLFIAGVALTASPLNASTISANFTDGSGNTSPDQYTGTIGDGWGSAWSRFSQGGSGGGVFSVAPTVANTLPLDLSDPNYLEIDYSYTKASGANITSAGVRRTYDANVVDPTKAHTVSFLFRMNSMGSHPINIALRGANDVSSSTGSYGWTLNWSATGWNAFNGNGSGSQSLQNISGVSQTVGTVYEVTVSVDPAAGKWGVSITDGTTTGGLDNLGFRFAGQTLDTTLGFVASTDYANVGATANFSIDRLTITQIPEPGTAMALLGGGAVLAAARGLYRKTEK